MKSLALAAGTRRPHAHAAESEAARRERLRAEDVARERALYGARADDARILRTRGFTVTAEGEDRFRVGNQVLDGVALSAKADRERRLMGATAELRQPSETATGLRIGQSVAIARKAKSSAPKAAPGPRKLSGAALRSQTVAAQHSTDLGVRPRVVWLDLALLTVDRRYQRPITAGGEAHINRILRGFNWNHYQPIVVTEQAEGTYAVIDGQHRIEAAKKHPLIDSLPCYIIDAPDMAAQAEIFVAVNSDRRALTGLQKFWASAAAGNREAQALVKACAAAGVTIARAPPQGGLSAMTLLGPNVALRLIGTLGRPAVLAAIGLLAEAWPTQASAFRVTNLIALATLASTAFSQARTVAALQRLDPDTLYAEALALAGTASMRQLAAATEKLIRKAMA
jgi:hypothetical protein